MTWINEAQHCTPTQQAQRQRNSSTNFISPNRHRWAALFLAKEIGALLRSVETEMEIHSPQSIWAAHFHIFLPFAHLLYLRGRHSATLDMSRAIRMKNWTALWLTQSVCRPQPTPSHAWRRPTSTLHKTKWDLTRPESLTIPQ